MDLLLLSEIVLVEQFAFFPPLQVVPFQGPNQHLQLVFTLPCFLFPHFLPRNGQLQLTADLFNVPHLRVFHFFKLQHCFFEFFAFLHQLLPEGLQFGVFLPGALELELEGGHLGLPLLLELVRIVLLLFGQIFLAALLLGDCLHVFLQLKNVLLEGFLVLLELLVGPLQLLVLTYQHIHIFLDFLNFRTTQPQLLYFLLAVETSPIRRAALWRVSGGPGESIGGHFPVGGNGVGVVVGGGGVHGLLLKAILYLMRWISSSCN